MSIFKQLLFLLLLAGLGYGGYEYWRANIAGDDAPTAEQQGPRPVSVELARAEARVMQRTIEAVGTTRALRSIDIVPEADGRLVELNITPGARVTEGQILARLDDTIERADLAQAEAVLTERSQSLERIRTLRQTNAVSQAALEETVARLAEAEAAADRARRRLADRVITAPFGGVVGLTSYDVGARVSEGQVLARLDDLGEVEVEFSLPETIFAQVVQGQTLVARAAAFPDRSFTGTIAAVDSRIDSISRAFRTRAVIPNPDSTLPAGMFLSLTLVLAESEHITVPEEAIVFQAAQTYVFVAEDDVARRRTVTTGQRRDGVIAITSGLSAGEEVVVRGLARVRDGAPLNIVARDRDATAESSAAAPEQPT
ncbi:efflux RND transporter periplasmic adaptor subunit [Roseovarius autotrophicus]|uniref:efflux RND transporter periplasmic adaptor subunit n=1 Tax=Roseovarius autotrophicus TaxID=2824121 RepID=UPI0019D98003|nr:efflux RND transporter periplasmic adaptor subunit [Roseovarius autotrophicus]MBE0452324.1 efflux RND transporter periplasmic adaptor subunit [Roseovarius sp.]